MVWYHEVLFAKKAGADTVVDMHLTTGGNVASNAGWLLVPPHPVLYELYVPPYVVWYHRPPAPAPDHRRPNEKHENLMGFVSHLMPTLLWYRIVKRGHMFLQ